MKCWYRWLLSKDLYLEETDTIRIGLEHASSESVIEHLCPYLEADKKKLKPQVLIDKEMKEAFSFESMRLRIDITDKIIKQYVTL